MLRTLFPVALCALVVGCVAPPESEEPPTDEPPALQVTSIELTATEPRDGDTFFYGGDPLELRFDGVPDGVTLLLDGVEAVGEPGESLWVFRAGQVLEPETTYTAEITWSEDGFLDATATLEFTTSAHGPEVTTPGVPAGAMYELAMTSGQLLSPPGLQAIYHLIIPPEAFAFGFTDDSDPSTGELQMRSAVVTTGSYSEQNPCQETAEWSLGADGVAGTDDDTNASWDNPRFAFGPADVTPPRTGWPFGFHSLRLSGLMHPEGDSIVGITYQGIFDSRAVEWPGGENYCDLLASTANIECVACPGDEEDIACLEFDGVDMKAHRTDADVVPVGCDDVLDRVAEGTCSATYAALYDADGDGTYEGCPTWTD